MKYNLLFLLILLAFCACSCESTENIVTDGDSENDETSVDGDGDEEVIDGDNESVVEDGDNDAENDDEEFEIDGDSAEDSYEQSEETVNKAGNSEYLIITNEELKEAFQPLADWKNRKGIPSEIKTVEDIYKEFDGVDDAEKVRNYLIDMYANSDLMWVLLGGQQQTPEADAVSDQDTPLVPHRQFYCETLIAGEDYDGTIASDLYFSDLDGTWDDNENGVWGEVDDNLDMYTDLFVTRVPVDTVEEAQTFVNKVLAYEQNPPEDFATDVLFLSEDTGFFGIDSSMALDPFGRDHFPERFDIKKLYRDPTLYTDAEQNSRDSQYDATNFGYNLYAHFGHGGGRDVGHLDEEDLMSLTNSPRNGVFISTACESGAFWRLDTCGGDNWLRSPDGGGVAYTGYTNTGIGYPSGMNFIIEFYDLLLDKDNPIVNFGQTYSEARQAYTNDKDMHKELHPDRWSSLSMVAFGDPEMPIWTYEPKEMEVEHNNRGVIGQNRFKVYATANGKALKNAKVTISDDEGEWNLSAITDEDGKAEICFEPEKAGKLHLTVTALHFIPYKAKLSITDSE